MEKSLLKKAIEKLNKREKSIVEMRFGLNNKEGEEMTQKEVADFLGISQSYISRLEKKIMNRLKKEIVKYEWCIKSRVFVNHLNVIQIGKYLFADKK